MTNEESGFTHASGGGGYGPPPGGTVRPGVPRRARRLSAAVDTSLPAATNARWISAPGYPGGPPMAPQAAARWLRSAPRRQSRAREEVTSGSPCRSSRSSAAAACSVNHVYMAHLAKQALAQGDVNTAREKTRRSPALHRRLCALRTLFLGTILRTSDDVLFAASS